MDDIDKLKKQNDALRSANEQLQEQLISLREEMDSWRKRAYFLAALGVFVAFLIYIYR